MLRITALALALLLSTGVVLPFVESSAHGLRQYYSAKRYHHRRHSRAWWRRYRARMARLRMMRRQQAEIMAHRRALLKPEIQLPLANAAPVLALPPANTRFEPATVPVSIPVAVPSPVMVSVEIPPSVLAESEALARKKRGKRAQLIPEANTRTPDAPPVVAPTLASTRTTAPLTPTVVLSEIPPAVLATIPAPTLTVVPVPAIVPVPEMRTFPTRIATMGPPPAPLAAVSSSARASAPVTVIRPQLPAGWSTLAATKTGEIKFRTETAPGVLNGQVSLDVVAQSRPNPMYMSAREERRLLAGVAIADLRRIVIDKMISDGGWVTNDYFRDISGMRVFIVTAQTPGDRRSPDKSWNFYFTEVNGRIYRLTTNTPPQFSERMAAEAESFIASLSTGSKPATK
jgi:hypothetical protein